MSNRRHANGAAPLRVLLAVTVTGRPGTEGTVAVHSQYDRPTTVGMLRRIADKFEAGEQPTAGEDTAP